MPPTGGVRRLHQLQQKMVSPQLGFPHRAGGIVRGDNSFRLPSIGVVDTRKGFCSEDGIIRILPGCRWLHEPQPISNQPVGLGFPHRAGRHRHGRPLFWCPVCWGCMYGKISDLGMGSKLPRVVISRRTPGWGFHTVRSGIDPGCHRFCPLFGGVVDVWKCFYDLGMARYPLRVSSLPLRLGISTPSGSLLTRGTTYFVLGWL